MAQDEMKLRMQELFDNPAPRVPVCLALDTSASMSGEKVRELNAAIAAFYRAVLNDELARSAAEVAVVSFGGRVEKVADFASMSRQRIPLLQPNGMTPMGGAVMMALDMLEQCKRIYSSQGVDYFQLWLVLMTDGEATDDIRAAAARCRDLVERRKLTVFPIAVGREANVQKLAEFSPRLSPLRIESTDLGRFFAWLSKSASSASMSNPGDRASADIGEVSWKRFTTSFDAAMKKA